MKNRKLAARYARALLDAVADPAQAETIDEFLTALAEAMESSRALRDQLLDPGVPRSSRKKALELIAESHGMPAIVKNFFFTVVDHGRTSDLPMIAEVYRGLRQGKAGILSATMTTAAALPDDLKQRARQALERRTGQRVEMTFDIEPSIIGGAVTQVGSTLYDGSVRTQLLQLRRRMIQE